MNNEIILEGRAYISAAVAASRAGFTRDYVARLCREGKITSRRIGTTWFVDAASLDAFLSDIQKEKQNWREALREERVREYVAVVPRVRLSPRKQAPSTAFLWEAFEKAVTSPERIERKKETGHAVHSMQEHIAKVLANPIVRTTDAAKQATVQSLAHAPSFFHLTDILQRVFALALAFSLTFGTYSVVDAEYRASVALAARTLAHSIADTPRVIATLAQPARVQSVSAALVHGAREAVMHPGAQVAAVGGVATEWFASAASAARALIDASVYRIVYSGVNDGRLVRGTPLREESTVNVAIVPIARPAVVTTPAVNTVSRTVVQQPVIERVVERERTVLTSEVTRVEFERALQELDNKLTARVLALSAAQSTDSYGPSVAPSYPNTYGLTQRIDRLSGVSITNATISGGSISGVALGAEDLTGVVLVAHGGTGTSTLPSYGQLLLGNSSGGYDLVATSSLGISGGAGLPGGADGTVQYNNGGVLNGAPNIYFDDANNRIGVGTSSPYAALSVVGETVSTFFTATSTAATSTFPNATMTNLLLAGKLYDSSTSAGTSGYVLQATASGVQWVATSSLGIVGGSGASFGQAFELTGGALVPTTTVGLIVSASSTFSGGLTVSNATTTHATSTNLFASVLSATNGAIVGLNATYATATQATTTNLSALNASTTNLRASSLTLASLSGFLKATAGAVSTALVSLTTDVTGILGITNGGTGTSTLPSYGQLLLGNSSGGYDLVATSSLGITSGVWGNITGTLSAQSDVQSALDAKLSLSDWYSTTTSDIAEGSNLYFTTARATTSFVGNLAATTSIASITTLPNLSLPYAQLTGTPAISGYPFALTGNATSTLTQFNGGLTAYASSTIGNGTAAGGLTVSGTATSTNAVITAITSSLLKTNALGQVTAAVGGTDYIANAAGDWTGTFDGQEGSYYLNASNLANFGTPFYTFFSATTTDALAQGVTNKYYSDALVNAYLHASSTLPKTYTANLFTAPQTFGNASTTLLSSGYASSTQFFAGSATTTQLYTSTFAGAGLSTCSGSSDKLLWNATTRQFECGADAGAGGGITALKAQYSSAQTGSTQTFATSSDANIGLTITSSGDIHTFAPTWSGTLAATRGGTGLSSIASSSILVGGAGDTILQMATSSLGLPTFSDLGSYLSLSDWYSTTTSDIAEGSNLYFTTARATTSFVGNLAATTSIASITTLPNLSLPSSQVTGLFAYPFPSAATSTLLTFSGGLTVSGGTVSLPNGQIDNAELANSSITVNGQSISLGGSGTITAASSTLLSDTNSWSGRNLFTNASSTLFSSTYASSTNAFFGNLSVGSLTGLLKATGGAVTTAVAGTDYVANTSGDWTGTLDGYEASALIAAGFSTTSANYWESQQTARTADDLTNNSIEDLSDVAAITENYGDLLYWNGSAWSDVATSSLGLPTFAYLFPNNATTTLLAFNGGLTATAATSTTLFGGAVTGNVARFGQTATSSFNASGQLALAGLTDSLLYTNGSNVVSATSISSPLSFSSGTLSIQNAAADGTTKGAAAFTANDFDAASGVISLDYTNGQKASGSQAGFLSATDWTTFNSKQAALTFTYPLSNSANTVSLAFGTTTSNTWGGTQTFTNAPVLATFTGLVGANNGATYAISTSSLNANITGNAGTATALQNARTINGTSFDGTANITITAASSTLLSDTSTFSGANTFTGNTTLTNATSTSLAVTNLSNTLVKANASGSLIPAVAGTDYQAAGTYLTALGNGYATTTATAVTIATSSASFNGLTAGLVASATNGALTLTPSLTGTLNNAGLTNSSVSFGGVSVSLGGSDATPAFNLQDATGLPIATGVSGLGTGIATFLATPSSANLAAALTDETGSGAAVFGTSPTLSGATLNGNTTLAYASSTALSTSYASSTNAFFGNLSVGSLNGPLQANGGVVSATTSVGVLYGGTGLNAAPTYGQVLLGQSNGTYELVATSSLGLSSGGSAYPFPLTGNATSTLTQFNGGLTAYASSTIGNGTAAGGLTVSGTATSTNAVITAITSSLLKTNALGQVTAAVGDTDYVLPATLTSNYVDGAGSGATSRVAYWSDSNTLTSNSAFTFDGTTLTATELRANGASPYFTMTDTDTSASFRIDSQNGSATINADVAAASANSYLAFALDGSEAARFDSSLRLGLGTTSPWRTLSVNGSSDLGINALAGYFTATSTTQSTFPNLLSTTATTTNLAITGITSSLLKTNSLGQVAVAVAGTDYANFSYPFPSAATSTNLTFSNGLTVSGGTVSFPAGQIDNAELANSTISGIALGGNLADLTATNGTLTFSGTYNGSTARTIGLNLGNANTWTALQQFGNASSTQLSAYRAYFGGTATTTIDGAGNLSVAGSIGAGTTTPTNKLTIFDSSAPQLSLSAGAGVAQWAFRNAGGDLFLATTTVAGTATTTTSALTISGSGFGTTTVTGLTINGQATSTSNVGFNITSGCFAVNGVCVSGGGGSGDITAVGSMTSGDAFADATADDDWLGLGAAAGRIEFDDLTVDEVNILSANVGIGTSTPYSKLSVWGNSNGAARLFELVDSASTTLASFLENGTGYFLGNIGIGTTTPWRKFSVTDTSAQTAIAYDATRYTTLQTDSVGDFVIDPQGGDVSLLDDNAWICAGGSCPTGSPAGTGNLVVETRLGVGTSTPQWPLQVAGTLPSLALSDTGSGGTNLKHWLFSSMGGNLYVGTTTDTYATSTPAALTITNAGNIGVSTSSPSQQLSVGNLLYVGANGNTTLGTATSTIQGDLRITGKLDVSTIDPVYTIGGTKYATYGHSTVGIKEEATAKVALTTYEEARGLWKHEIRFDELERGSDLWLFYQVTEFGPAWESLVITLTPAFDGRAFYEEDREGNRITIYGDKEGSVSARFVANRYDADKWPNLRPDQDGSYKGHEIGEKKGGIRAIIKSIIGEPAEASI